jgi:hypothetical protein
MARSKVLFLIDPLNGKLYTIKCDRIRQYPAGTTIHKNGKSSQPATSEISIGDANERQSWMDMVGLVSV